MTKIHLRVVVPKNRDLRGTMRVEKNGRVLREIPVLARGSRRGGNTAFLENGNTPTGTYAGSLFSSNQGWPLASYGAWGRIQLRPVEGDAVIAEQLFGRTGLYIHGGDLATKGAWKGGLKPTYGCLRVSNGDMLFLREVFLEDDDQQMTRATAPVVEVSVTD